MIVRYLIVPFAVAALAIQIGGALAQGGFPAPLPGQAAAPATNASPFPPVNGAAPQASVGGPSPFTAGAPPVGGMGPPPQQSGPPGGGDDCMKGFAPLRQEAEKRGNLIKAASERRAPPDEACKLIGNFSQAEIKMIKYVESHAQKCGIPPQISEQLKGGHKNTEKMMKQVCSVAQQAAQRGPAGPSLSDVLGSSSALPEASSTKRGGSTFDTLSGNVLAR